MKNQIRTIEFTSKRIGSSIKFKVDVRVKEGFLTRLTNLFRGERVVTTWMEEQQASSASNYLYNEIKKLKKSFVVKDEGQTIKEDWEMNLEKTVGPSAAEKKKKTTAKVVAEGSAESSKPKRNYKRKPRKEKTVEIEK